MALPKQTPDQIKGSEYAMKNPYSILAADPGLGKSRMAIDVSQAVKARSLIICPSHLIINWYHEVKKWAHKDTIVTVIQKGSEIFDLFDTDFAIVSYELAQKAENFFEWANVVILDEAHYIKTQESKRAFFIHKNIYENSIERVMLLTGTPIKNRVAEYYSLLAVCNYDPNIADSEFLRRFPDSISFADYFSYRHEYYIEIGNRQVKVTKWIGLRRVDELKKYLKGHYIRIKDKNKKMSARFKDFFISDLPDDALRRDFEAYFKGEGTDSVGSKAKKMAAVKKAPITIKYAKDLLEEVDCVCIYSDHIESSEIIAKEFGVTALNGNVPAEKRFKLAKRFQEGEGRVLVATIPGLGIGVDLTRSYNMILNDYPWVPGDLKQTIHRIQRITQKRRPLIHRMIGSPQDLYIMNTIQEKMKVIDLIA